MQQGPDPLDWLLAATATLDEARRGAIVVDTVAAVLDELPELADADLRSDLTDLAVECLRSILFVATLPRDARADAPVPVAGLDFCRTLARRDHEVVVLFKVFRTGHSRFWASIMDVAHAEIADPELRMGVLTLMWERLSRWLDALMDRLARAYQEERERWLRGALARRAEVVAALLAGEVVHAAAASATLGYDLARVHTAFAIRAVVRETGGPVMGLLETAAEEVAAALGAGRALTLPSGAHGLWGWVATATPPDRTQLADRLARHGSVTVAVGRPAPSVDGFRRSHREALAAQRAAAAARTAAPLTRYEDVELVSLLSADPEAMRAFVANELGGLARDGRGAARLRETALVLLRCGGNRTAAARRLGVHRNTVGNRTARAEELLGATLDPASVRLQLALQLAVEVDLDRVARA